MPEFPPSIGRYEVQRLIARGGMGTLYLAADPVLQRQVAIKLLREGDDPELRARFTREARAAANLRHRNIVTIFDIGEHEGRPFMAMEYVQGRTLGDVIHSDPPPSTIRRLQFVEEICDGLAYAHRRGVIHRDVKPANLMLDAEGVLKILDFGIARAATDAGITQAGLLIGTLSYMSPEQVAGRPLDSRSDMFAVGAVMYELLARRQAFPGTVDTGVLNRILNGEPEPLATLCPHLDPAIPAIITRALQKDPALRFRDLQEMRAEVAQVRHGMEIAALPDVEPPPEPAREPARTTSRRTDREEIVRRRALQIEQHLTAARGAFDVGDDEAAISACEEALLLDPNEMRAVDLAERARLRRDETNARRCLAQAQDRLRRGELTTASGLVREALALLPESPEALELSRQIAEAHVTRARDRERDDAVRGLVERARASLDHGDAETALVACDDALSLAPAHPEATQLRLRSEQQRDSLQRRAADEEAHRAVAEARRIFEAGDREGALGRLEQFWPSHPLVSAAWTELAAEADGRAAPPAAAPGPGAAGDATVFVPREPVTPTAVPATNARADGSSAAARVAERPPVRSVQPPADRSRAAAYAAAAVVVVVLAIAAGYLALRPDAGTVDDPLQVADTEPTGFGTDTASRSGAAFDGGNDQQPDPGLAGVPGGAEEPAESPAASGGDATPAPATREGGTTAPPPATQPVGRGGPAPAPPVSPPAPPAATARTPSSEADVPSPRPPATDADTPAAGTSREEAAASPEEPAAAPVAPPAVTPPPPVAPPRPVETPPAPPSPERLRALEEAQIQQTMQIYVRAYNDLDAAAVARVFPSVDAKRLADAFRGFESQALELTNQVISIEGARATVTGNRSLSITPRGSRTQTTNDRVRFVLEKDSNRWVIVESR